jgi:hypothetical protein
MKKILSVLALALLLAFAVVVAQDSTKSKADQPAQTERPKQTPVTPAEKPATGSLAAEIQICTSITDRACTGGATTFDANVGKLYCLSQITGGTGDGTIKHIWSHAGKVVAEVPLTIKGSRWRTWSSKTIPASWTGEWTVRVVDASGAELKSVTFTVGK